MVSGSLKTCYNPVSLTQINTHNIMQILPDTRPYPTDPVKNDLLLYATQIAHATSSAQRTLAQEQLRGKIHEMLAQNFYLSLSVAMSMAGDEQVYAALMDTLDSVLHAQNPDEVQWFALPVIVVAGAKQANVLPHTAPSVELAACLANYPTFRPLTHAKWLPNLIRADDFAAIKADKWFAAKQNIQAAEHFAQTLPESQLAIPADQSVHAFYALGYGNADLLPVLGQNLREAALPLMQVWQQSLATQGLTLFTNPLSPNAPLAALTDASHMRLRMALDVFAANAIRAIRLQSPRVGVVMAAQEGGKLLFGFNTTDQAFELPELTFTWQLSPRESIGVVQQNFLNLMADCQVEHIYQLDKPLLENETLPTYSRAQQFAGHNPLFATM